MAVFTCTRSILDHLKMSSKRLNLFIRGGLLVNPVHVTFWTAFVISSIAAVTQEYNEDTFFIFFWLNFSSSTPFCIFILGGTFPFCNYYYLHFTDEHSMRHT